MRSRNEPTHRRHTTMTTQPTLSRRKVLAGTAGAAGTAVAGCLGLVTENDDADRPVEEDDASGEPGHPTVYATVDIRAKPWFKFEPNLVHLQPGGTVTWEVVDDYRHAVASYHPETHRHQRIPDDAEPWQSGLLRDGSTFEHTFEREGIYDYVDIRSLCSSHEAIGGVGRVIVGWPDIESEPAYQHDVEVLPSRAETVLREINERSYELLENS